MNFFHASKNVGFLATLAIAVLCGSLSVGILKHQNSASSSTVAPAAPVLLLADGTAPPPMPPSTGGSRS
jgi:hypothetical protein